MPKSFVPLESNPEIFSSLSHRLGLGQGLAFHDVFSIDDPELLAFVPRPVAALILVFPVSEAYEEYRKKDDATRPADYYTKVAGTPAQDALWYRQTIRNACGLYAILHALTNGVEDLQPDSYIQSLIKRTEPATVDQRSQILENDPDLESLYAAQASKGSTQAPDASDEVNLHFVCFTRARGSGHFVELDGRRNGPIDLGELPQEADMLTDKVLAHVRSFMQRETKDPSFSILALAPSFD